MFGIEFFPTPPEIATKMVAKIQEEAQYFLEPSAGKGDLAEAIKRRFHHWAKVDCIECSPELVAVLTDKKFPVVGFDWISYDGVSYYDAIIMNPPFSNGAEHLLKAWNFLHAGEIVCLLNAETINNPYTKERQLLAEIIANNGTVEHLGPCFKTAERSTNVYVVMVHLKKAAADDLQDLWAHKNEEKEHQEGFDESNMLAIRDQLTNMQHYYDKANEHMFEAFRHMKLAGQYMQANSINPTAKDYNEVYELGTKNVTAARAEFTKLHRKDAWSNVFEKMQFRKWLDAKQTEAFLADVERSANVPFTADNIKGTLENVYLQRRKLFEQSVSNVFDELIKYDKDNQYHTEGWATNSDHKVNKKLVFPYGCKYEKYWGFQLMWGWKSRQIYEDLDRIMCVLDGKDFEKCLTVSIVLQQAFKVLKDPQNFSATNTCQSQYFDIKFFKKGTVHLKFKDERLWQEFNIAAAKGKAWLGKAA